MCNSNSPKSGITADLTKVANEAYKDTLKEPLKSGSGILSTTLNFIHNTILYPMQKYNLYAESKLSNYQKELEEKAKSIPAQNLIEPRVNILGPTVEGLKYNLDETHIKEMFTNILLSEMDNRKQTKVLPSYIEIVKQLSTDDANFLKFIKTSQLKNNPLMQLIIRDSADDGYYYLSNDMFLITKQEYQLISSIVLDNLSRLKIVDIDFTNWLNDDSIYDKVFEKIKEDNIINVALKSNEKLDFSKGLLKITDFGKNLIDICLS